jgi:hypothetical protein
MQAQTSLTLFIPNQPLCRQGKYFYCLLEYFIDIIYGQVQRKTVKSICGIPHTGHLLSISMLLQEPL